jgi:hypothetical protein
MVKSRHRAARGLRAHVTYVVLEAAFILSTAPPLTDIRILIAPRDFLFVVAPSPRWHHDSRDDESSTERTRIVYMDSI